MAPNHVRPKIRKSSGNGNHSKGKLSASSESSSPSVEHKMGSWMGLSSSTNARETTGEDKSAKPASILKTPKYSSATKQNVAATVQHDLSTVEDQGNAIPEKPSKVATTQPSAVVVCEDFVVERDPYRPIRKKGQQQSKEQHQTSHSAVEGYQPTLTEDANKASNKHENFTNTSNSQPNEDKNGNDDPNMVILSSLEDLMIAAGEELPEDRTKITPDTKLVEADLAFSVMTQEQYGDKMTEMKREMEENRDDMYKMFMGSDDIFGSNSSGDDDSEGEEEFLNFLMEQRMTDDADNYYHDEDEEGVQEAEPRAFSFIWNALSEWLTPEAVEWMARLENPESDMSQPLYSNNWTPQVDRSDIGASRCAGLMAMVKMYLPSSMKELNHPDDMRRAAEHRIGDLLRTFDYSTEAPKLQVKMWKAVTCILLDMVLIESRAKTVDVVPPAVQDVGMTVEEYRYLTRSAVQALHLSNS